MLLREVPVAGHRHRGVRLRAGHVHLLAARRVPGDQLRVAHHRGRHRRPGVPVHAVRHAVPAAARRGPADPAAAVGRGGGRSVGVERWRRRRRRYRDHGRVERDGRVARVSAAERGRGHGRGGRPVVRPHARVGRRMRRRRRRRRRPAQQQAAEQDEQHADDAGRVRQRSGQAVAVRAQPARADSRVAQQVQARRGVLRQPEPEASPRRRHHVQEGHILQREPVEREQRAPQKVSRALLIYYKT